MKVILYFFAVLLESLAFNAQAGTFFMGADVAPATFWTDRCVAYILCYSESDLGGISNGLGIRVGQWLPHNNISKTGWEIGYDKLGSISGSTSYITSPGCIILCPGTTATWKHEATAMHVEVLGGVPWDNRQDNGTFFGKIGIYRSFTKTEGTYVPGGSSYSRQVVGTGLLLGAGYIFPFTHYLSVRGAVDLITNVKVADPINPAGTISEALFKFSLGVDYTF